MDEEPHRTKIDIRVKVRMAMDLLTLADMTTHSSNMRITIPRDLGMPVLDTMRGLTGH
jgi:hypothetical protein